MDQNMREEMIRNLKDAGCGANMIGNFMKGFDEQNIEEQLVLLEQQRDRLLERVHREEKRISCLDYLVYQIRKKPLIQDKTDVLK